MDSEPFAEKNETNNSEVVHVDCFISTQEQRPIENGTANVFLTSALTPGSASITERTDDSRLWGEASRLKPS